jgi:hypothetical protein
MIKKRRQLSLFTIVRFKELKDFEKILLKCDNK